MHWKKQWWQHAGTYPAQDVTSQTSKKEAEATEPRPPAKQKIVKESKMPDRPEKDRYMMTVKAADFLHLSPRTLERMRVDGTGPTYHKAGPGKRARVLYRLSDLREWLEGNSFTSTSEYGN